MASALESLPERMTLTDIVARIILAESNLRIVIDRRALGVRLLGAPCIEGGNYPIEAAFRSARRGAETLLIPQDDLHTKPQPPDVPFMKALARGHSWFIALASGQVKSIRELAKLEEVTDRYVSRQLTFAFMAPKLVEAVVSGQRRFATLCIEDLRERQLPLSWHLQCDTNLGKRHDADCHRNARLNSRSGNS